MILLECLGRGRPGGGWEPEVLSHSNSFYSPELNVHVVHVARDGRHGSMWAYRYGSGRKVSKGKDAGAVASGE
jgi:hypothetical protein